MKGKSRAPYNEKNLLRALQEMGYVTNEDVLPSEYDDLRGMPSPDADPKRSMSRVNRIDAEVREGKIAIVDVHGGGRWLFWQPKPKP